MSDKSYLAFILCSYELGTPAFSLNISEASLSSKYRFFFLYDEDSKGELFLRLDNGLFGSSIFYKVISGFECGFGISACDYTSLTKP